MASNLKFLSFILITGLVFSSCKKDPETVSGCTDPLGDNYNAEATIDNSTCTFQKRFLGDYSGTFDCKDQFKAVFSMAELSITELIKKDEVNITIQSTIGPLPVMGKIIDNKLVVDATLKDLPINARDISPLFPDIQIIATGTVTSTLSLDNTNKILTGSLKLTLKPTSPPEYAILSLTDNCDLTATKK
jgi:hypothetical protein